MIFDEEHCLEIGNVDQKHFVFQGFQVKLGLGGAEVVDMPLEYPAIAKMNYDFILFHLSGTVSSAVLPGDKSIPSDSCLLMNGTCAVATRAHSMDRLAAVGT